MHSVYVDICLDMKKRRREALAERFVLLWTFTWPLFAPHTPIHTQCVALSEYLGTLVYRAFILFLHCCSIDLPGL